MNLVFRLAVFLAFIPAFASAQLVPVTNILFQNSVTADQGLFNNVTGSTVSATTVTAGNITASGNITAAAGTVQAVTGKFDSVILGGGNIEDALFPLTKDADLGGFSLTNGAVIQANTGTFDSINLNGEDLESTYFKVSDADQFSNLVGNIYFTKTEANTLSNNIEATYFRETEADAFSNTVYDSFLRMQGGSSNSVVTDGREVGMFIKYAGDNTYTHDFSSVRFVIGPDGQGGILTNVPSEKLEFIVDETNATSPILITLTNMYDGVNFTNERDKAHVLVNFEANPNFVAGIDVIGQGTNNVTITNTGAPAIRFSPPSSGVVATHRIDTNDNSSIIDLLFDGSLITNLVYRGEYDPQAVYGSNEIVVVTSDFSDEGEDPIIGVNLFADAYISQSATAFTNDGPNPLDLDVSRWRLFSTRGSKGADGVANLMWGGRYIPTVPYASNTFVSFQGELYNSLVEIDGGAIGSTNYSIFNTNYWEKVVRAGEDGDDGVNAGEIREIITYTNFPVSISNLTFRGDYEEVAPYYHYDVVTAGGSTYYLNTNAINGQTQELPSGSSSDWSLFVSKGQDGNVSVSGLTFGNPITYTPGVAYLTNQVVEHQGSLWLCISNTASSPLSGFSPPSSTDFLVNGTTNNTYWSMFVPRGRDGKDGMSIGFSWQGEFVKNESYNPGETLYFEGGIYEVLSFNPAPSASPNESPSTYRLLIRSGTDGAPGGNLNFKGNWSGGIDPPVYVTNDVVYYKPGQSRGGLWLAIQGSGGLNPGPVTPSDTGNNSLYWDRLVSDGVDGSSLSGLTFRGDWVAGTYGTNDVVRYLTSNGWSLWVPKADGTTSQPNNLTWWLISSGIQGSPGGPGPEGPKGEQGVPGVGSLVFLGGYSPTTLYTTNHLIRFDDKVWYVAAGPISNAPPSTNPEFWGVFLEDGEDGENAVGDMYFAGQYATNVSYDTNSVGALPMVQFGNAVYVLTNHPTSFAPTDSDYWLKLFEGIAGPKGDQGDSVTNAAVVGDALFVYVEGSAPFNAGDVRGLPGLGLSFLGDWNTNTVYTTNDLVAYTDGTYYSKTTNNQNRIPSTNSAFWGLFTPQGPQGGQGVQGVQGPKGDAGAAVSYVGVWNSTNVYTASNLVYYAGSTWYALAASTNKVPTDTLAGYWAPFATASATLIPRGAWTNITYTTNEVVYYDGSSYYSITTNNTANPTNTASWQLLAQKGDDIKFITSPWSVVYSDGSTNSISLPLGVSNSVLMSTGANSAPEWSTNVTLSTGGGGGGDVYLASNNVFTATNKFNKRVEFSGANNSTAFMQMWDFSSPNFGRIWLYSIGSSGAASVNIGANGANAAGAEGVVLGWGSQANNRGIALGRQANASGAEAGIALSISSRAATRDAIALGADSYAGVGTAAIAIGRKTDARGKGTIAIGGADGGSNATDGAQALSDYAIALGRYANPTEVGSAVISDSIVARKLSQGTNTITFSFNNGAYFTQTNTVYASITPSGITFPDGTTQTTAGVAGSTTVTNLPNDLAYIDISNNWTAAQSLPANSTIGGGEFGNVITPVTVSTNVSGTWTIELSSDTPVGIYHQAGNFTNVLFDVDSTNDMILGQVLLLATTNAITWPTNDLVWASGSEPSLVDGEYNKLYFESWRGKTFGVYVGSVP